jgi:hypothetical protein
VKTSTRYRRITVTQPSDNLFRFMMLRPAQHRPDNRRRNLFIDPGDFGSNLVEALDATITFASRQAVADQYIRSDEYVSGFDDREPWVAALRLVLAALGTVRTDDQVSRVRDAVVGAPPLVDPELLATVERRLWESLYAAYLSPRTDPRDRAELIGLLRALTAVQQRETLTTAYEVKRILTAQPLVPSRWFTAGKGGRPDPVPAADVPVEWRRGWPEPMPCGSGISRSTGPCRTCAWSSAVRLPPPPRAIRRRSRCPTPRAPRGASCGSATPTGSAGGCRPTRSAG